MASWHNSNSSYSSNMNNENISILQLPPPPLPSSLPQGFNSSLPAISPTMAVPPVLTSVPPPLFNTIVPHYMCNTEVPPPLLHLFPPPCSEFEEVLIEENNFKAIKKTLEECCRNAKKKKEHVELKVSDVKAILVQYFNHIQQLERIVNCMQITYKSLSIKDWDDLYNKAQKIKAELLDLTNDIQNPEMIRLLKTAVKLRKNKRNYRKRKQREWKEQKNEAHIHSEQENRRIDLWLEKMKDEAARMKREENIKKEADLILSDVTAKKAEAKRILKMLNSLFKLRMLRAQNLPSAKSYENDAFNEIIDRLKKIWLKQLNDYNVEEDGLKVMLGHAEEERASVEAAALKKNLKSWTRCLFGSSNSYSLHSVDELVQIRHDWDKFICTENIPLASSIPAGWVLPQQPSSEEWEKLL